MFPRKPDDNVLVFLQRRLLHNLGPRIEQHLVRGGNGDGEYHRKNDKDRAKVIGDDYTD